MAKVSTYLDTRRQKADGKFPLKFAVSSCRGTRILYPIGIDIESKYWNGHEVVRHESRLLYNQLIGYKRLEIERTLLEVETHGPITSQQILKRVVENALAGRTKSATYPVTDAFEAKMRILRKESNKDFYRRTLDAIAEFAPLDGLMMKDISYGWVCEFEAHLRKHNKTNTVSIILRTLRAVFNHLIKSEEIEADCYPFRKFSIKQEETRKLALTVEQLRKIRDAGTRASDIFMLMFYLIGINAADLCRLKEITPDGRIEYRRMKTGRMYSIKVEPEAMAIIEKYRGQDWLINIFDRRKNPNADHRTFMYKMNKQLKKITPGVSTNCARHSWATISQDLDMPIEVTTAGMGHSYGSKTTAIYIKPNRKKVDDANRRIIDYVNEDLSTR